MAGNLDNNTQYTFTVKALNKVNYSPPRTSEPFQSLGTPLPPGTPTVTDLESGSDRTSTRISWPSTLPEGPGPTLYTLSYTSSRGAANVPGCVRVQATTCVHGGVEYDGTTYAYSVRAHNVEKTSGASQPATFQAVGRPAPWGAWSVGPTGADQQLRVSATAPDSRGDKSIATILVGGQPVWENSVAAGAVINEVVPTSTNEGPHQVQLRMCNESAADGGCSLSDARTAQSYGPLRSSHLRQPTASVNGLNVVWTISGTSNGDAAIAGVSINGGPEEAVRLNGPGGFSFTRSVSVADFNTRTSVQVRLYDDAPSGRGEAYTSNNAESGDPPPPTVRMRRGISCDDDSDDPGVPNCQVGPVDPACTESSCAKVFIDASGFTKAFRCEVVRGGSNGWFEGWLNRSGEFERAVYQDFDWYFASGYVEIRCFTADGKQQGNAGTNW